MDCENVTGIVKIIAVWKILRTKKSIFRGQTVNRHFIWSNIEIDMLGVWV